jgi:hypothetical protein
MKILFIASNPEDANDLNLVREMTELQLQVQARDGSPDTVSLKFLPDIRFEKLPQVLFEEKPDILHISSHSDRDDLHLANEYGEEIKVDASILRACIDEQSPPKMIYLSSCNSQAIAEALKEFVPVAIGSTATIKNGAARAATLALYSLLLSGSTVDRAYQACGAMISGMSNKQGNVKLFRRSDIDTKTLVLHQPIQTMAQFVPYYESPGPREGYLAWKNSTSKFRTEYHIRFGLVGCPQWTRQVIFFTDHPTFDEYDGPNLETKFCHVIRDIVPVRGVVWMDEEEEAWEVDGDFWVYAVGSNCAGDKFVISSTLCDALTRRYTALHGDTLPDNVVEAIGNLKVNDGS